eukprot:7378131-Prymnesium_polylepis.1
MGVGTACAGSWLRLFPCDEGLSPGRGPIAETAGGRLVPQDVVKTGENRNIPITTNISRDKTTV